MVDTVRIIFPSSDGLLADLRLAEEVRAIDTGTIRYRGYLNGFFVRIYPDGTASAQGSLPSLLWGSNTVMMRHADLQTACCQLVELLGCQPERMVIKRLDVASTLSLPHPISQYLGILGPAPYLKRVWYENESVIYRNRLRSLTFYDKAKESNTIGRLLRFEVQYKRRLEARFGQTVTIASLSDTAFFYRLVHLWHDEYCAVEKVYRHAIGYFRTLTELLKELARFALTELGGERTLLPLIDDMRREFDLNRTEVHRLKKRIRDLAKSGNCGEDRELVHELDHAMKSAVADALS